MDNLEKIFYEILNTYVSNEYLKDEDKVIELSAKCDWLNSKILEIKNSAKIKLIINKGD